MGAQKFFALSTIKTHLGFSDKGFLENFRGRKMLRLAIFFWVLACKCFSHLFGLIYGYMIRLNSADSSPKNDSDFIADRLQTDDQIASISETEKENHEFVFRFLFQNSDTENSVFPENSQNPNPNSNTNKYQFKSPIDFHGFIEHPETVSFSVQELFVSPNDDPNADNGNQNSGESDSKAKDSVLSEKPESSDFLENSPNQTTNKYQFSSTSDFRGFIEEPEVMRFSIQESCATPDEVPVVDNRNQEIEELNSKAEDSVFLGKNPKQEISGNSDFPGKRETDDMEINQWGPDKTSHKVGLISGNQFWSFDFEPKTSISTNGGDSVTNDFSAYWFSDEESDNSQPEFPEKIPDFAEVSFDNFRISDADDEFIELEPDLQRTGEERRSEKQTSQEKSRHFDSEDENGDDDEIDVLLKHQESIEQMKVEMKNSKSKGMLPTISEECETPKMSEDLKPLRIEVKFERKDRLEEIQKVYKGYAEKMRKLDVLNYQTMHAIGFLQLKDQIHQGSPQKSSISAIKSLLFPNLWPIKLRRIYADPMLKSIIDLHRNLELVYVGQTCVSWEILHWQYRKAIELVEDDCEGNCSYNQVAGEFQQFQVLVQRFVENEPFQGPRVQNYAKNRCDIRSLLHVPAIKDDFIKDKRESRVEDDYEVSAAILLQVIEESMHVFWEFLHADKDEANVVLKGIQSTIVDLQDPSDSELLMEIKTNLQKKEKRLKDILRSGNCIVKKFQKHEESRLEGKLLFAQVELKLVSRVLNMSRLTTDHLVWCQKKLNKINFVNRKLQLEPSFFLFPL